MHKPCSIRFPSFSYEREGTALKSFQCLNLLERAFGLGGCFAMLASSQAIRTGARKSRLMFWTAHF
jgi:hypothetical protein